MKRERLRDATAFTQSALRALLQKMHGFLLTIWLLSVGHVALGACARDVLDEEIEGTAQALRVSVGARALAYDYAQRDDLITAAAGDKEVVFVTEPLRPRVAVLDRFTGEQIDEVPAPPDGWLLPFALRVPEAGHLVVLDPGGFPSPTAPVVARVYDYAYRFDARERRFRAELSRTVRFDGQPLVFAEDVEVTSSGSYVVAESIIGALWVISPDGTISPGLFPGPAGPIPALAPCTFSPISVDGIPFGTAGDFGPGVTSVAERKGQLYFAPTCSGGLFRIPMASLTDTTRAPDQRAADIVSVSPRAPGVAETLHGLAFNRADPRDDAVYAADSFQLRVVRIDTRTGARQTLVEDPVLFNFPVKPQFLPPVHGLAPLLVPSDQEHRFPAINAAISEELFQRPWIVTKVHVPHAAAVRGGRPWQQRDREERAR